MPEEWAALLLYSLLHGNAHFREFVLSKSDLDVLVLVRIHSCYWFIVPFNLDL